MSGDTVQVILIVLPILLVSITVHELMHAWTAYKLGDDTAHAHGRISLNPMQHIDPFLTVGLPLLLAVTGAPIFGMAKPVQVNFARLRWGEYGGAIVAMVGPLINLLIAILAALVFRAISPSSTDLIYDILGYTVVLNVGFFVFNSIPWPPLDGSRLLYAFAPESVQNIMETIERMGLMGLVIFMLVFYQFISPLVSNVTNILINGLIN